MTDPTPIQTITTLLDCDSHEQTADAVKVLLSERTQARAAERLAKRYRTEAETTLRRYEEAHAHDASQAEAVAVERDHWRRMALLLAGVVEGLQGLP